MKGSCRKSNTFSMRKNDLEHYLKEKGVLLVVVNAIDTEHQAIKYATLTSLDLARYLQKCSNKKKIGIELTEIPEDINAFLSILLNFIDTFDFDCKEDVLSIQDLRKNYSNVFDKLQFTVKATSKETLKNILINQPILLTAINSADGYKILVDKFMATDISETKIINEPISINGRRFYDCYQITRYIGYSVLTIGNSLHIRFDDPADSSIKININYELKGELIECILDTEFIITMYSNKGFTIKDHDFKFLKKLETELIETQIKSLNYNLKKLQETNELLSKLNIKKSLDYFSLSKAQQLLLQRLVDGYLYKKEIHIDSTETVLLQIFDLGKIHILIEFTKTPTGTYLLNDFFKSKYHTYCARCNDTIKFPGSQFFVLDSSDFSLCDNINYLEIANSIKNLKIDTNVLTASYIYVSKMLLGYDKLQEKNKVILDSVIDICNHFLNNEVDEYANQLFFLKKIECNVRKHELNIDEKNAILEILDATSDNFIRLICHILLGNINMIEYVYNKMNEDQKELFSGNSIKFFLKNTNLNEEIKIITEQTFKHLP